MKKLYKYFPVIVMVLIAGSCREEEKNPIPDFTSSTIPVFTPGQNDTGFIDFNDLDASRISFTVDKLGSAPVENVDVTITYNNSETGQSSTVTYTTVGTLPGELNLTFDELIGLFSPQVVTADTLDLGDSFVVNGNVRLQDGRYLSGGYSPSVVANNPISLTYNVACLSELAGNYDFTLVSGTNGEVSSLPNQTITQIAPGYYELSDVSMDIFGPDFPLKYRFTDICGNFTPDAGAVDYPTLVKVKFNPGTAVDPATGEITFSVEYIPPSCCGLPGVKTIFKATPK